MANTAHDLPIVPLREAASNENSDGAMLYAFCESVSVEGARCVLRAADAELSVALGRVAASEVSALSGTATLVATILRKRSGDWFLIALRESNAFARWAKTRGAGVTVQTTLSKFEDQVKALFPRAHAGTKCRGAC